MNQDELKNQIAKDFSEYGDDKSKSAILEDLKDAQIIFYDYTYEDYEGSALCVYKKDDDFYIVEGSHCSCNELEGQWKPDHTTKEAIIRMCTDSCYGMFHNNKDDILARMAV